ncbi:MAG TPA: myo-inosose-2 dehydratase [Anaeromyxobacter sp.]|nr:myo-inosose-2 dehydratase [Anaeromyxobacter sp.]
MALEVKIGASPVAWLNEELPCLGGETSVEAILAEGRRIGYEGFELSPHFPREGAALLALFERHRLSLASGSWPGRLALRSVEEEERDLSGEARLLAMCGARVLVYREAHDSVEGEIDVPLYKRPRLKGELAWRAYGEKLTDLARRLLSRGLRLAYHPEAGAYVESPEDLDRLLESTGPELGLVLDTGHAVLGGGDPVDLALRHASRICHVHMKDVRLSVLRLAQNRAYSFPRAVLDGVFTVPGDGSVDFGRVLTVLSRHDYRGWLVVEADQDPAVAPSAAYAERGYRHVKELLRSQGSREVA